MNDIIRSAIDGGINWFDTAEIYGGGKAERSLAIALKAAGQKNGDVVVATKWFPIMRTARNISDTIDSRLRYLYDFDIDLYQVHFPYYWSSTSQIMNRMADLVKNGKIKSIGVSNFSTDLMCVAHKTLAERGLSLASNQVHYSLLNRRIERNGIIDLAKQLGITIIAYSPLESGLLSGKFHDNPQVFAQTPFWRRIRLKSQLEKCRSVINTLKEIAKAHNATPSQVALNWLINFHGETVVAIPGASKAEHVQDNAQAMHFKLASSEMDEIDKVTRHFR